MEYKSAIKMMRFAGRGGAANVSLTDEQREKNLQFIESEKRLLDMLAEKPELKQAFEQYSKACAETFSLEIDNYYEEGFRFGLLLGLDVAGFIKNK